MNGNAAWAQGAVPLPISYYTFDQPAGSTTLLDSIRGAAGQGTLYGYDEGGAFVPGLVGNALRFNGETTYVTAPLVGAALSEFTLSAWVKLNSTTNWGTILKNWGSASVGAFHFGIDDSSQFWTNYVGLADGSLVAVATPNYTTPTGVWTNLTTTVSQTAGEAKLYLNGALVNTTSFAGAINGTKPVMSFGVKLNDDNDGPGSPPGWLDGWLDEIAFFDLALSSQQVGNIYSSGTSGSSPIPVLSFTYWAPAAGAGGTETWTSGSDAFWAANADGSGSKQQWSNGVAFSGAVFGGIAGTVTTSGTVEANRLSFTTSGYTVAGGTTAPINFIGSSPAVTLASGVSTTISARIDASGPLAVTGTGSRGTLVLAGRAAAGQGVQVSNAFLSLSGTVQGDVSVGSTASLGGTGMVTGAISGAGSVGPGNSPGILTAGAVDPASGLDFAFEFSGTAPNYANAIASVNDVLRLTGDPEVAPPFTAALSSANVISVFFSNIDSAGVTNFLSEAGLGTKYTGAFFTDADTSFLSSVVNARYGFYFLGDGQGTAATYNGQSYYSLRNIDPNWTRTFAVGTEAATADFGGGSELGQVMTFTVAVPEPSTVLLLIAGALGSVAVRARRRHT